jgi:hypothetical protein
VLCDPVVCHGAAQKILGRSRPRNDDASATSLRAQAPTQDYLVFVASEGNDRISLVRFGPAGARVERVSKIGRNPTEPVGPHGIALSPDRRYYYVSTAHGFPNGELWKFSTIGDSLKGTVTLGAFPATLQLSPGRAVRLRRELQSARRDEAVVRVGRVRRRDGGGLAHHDVYDAARVASQPAGHEALLGVHDG